MVFKEIYIDYCFVMDFFWFYFAGIWFVCSQNFVVFIAFFEILLSFWGIMDNLPPNTLN